MRRWVRSDQRRRRSGSAGACRPPRRRLDRSCPAAAACRRPGAPRSARAAGPTSAGRSRSATRWMVSPSGTGSGYGARRRAVTRPSLRCAHGRRAPPQRASSAPPPTGVPDGHRRATTRHAAAHPPRRRAGPRRRPTTLMEHLPPVGWADCRHHAGPGATPRPAYEQEPSTSPSGDAASGDGPPGRRAPERDGHHRQPRSRRDARRRVGVEIRQARLQGLDVPPLTLGGKVRPSCSRPAHRRCIARTASALLVDRSERPAERSLTGSGRRGSRRGATRPL